MSKVKVSVEGHYELEDIPCPKAYVWTPLRAD